VDLRLLAGRAFGGGLLTAAVAVMAMSGTLFVLAVFLQTTHHLTPIEAGRWLLPVGVGAFLGAQAGGFVAAKSGPTIVVRTGIVVQLAGILAAAAVLGTDVGWLRLGASLALFGLGAGMASSQLTNVILSEVGRERAGSASGVATTNNSLAAALGVAILGGVLRLRSFADADSARWALLTAAALLAVGVGVSLRLPAARPAAGPHRGAPPGRGGVAENGDHDQTQGVPARGRT
jgi:predicted MFS family arabinose efflux permease